MKSGVKALGSTLGNVAAGGLKIFTAGVAAAATGVSALGTAAIKSYANYEQLVGGIETLFGTGGASVEEYADKVGKSVSDVQEEYNTLMEAQTLALDNAQKAYKTAGLSANEYMETVTSFAASLKQSTANEVEAAEAANQAVIDMSDNANKMGTNMEDIQNAYQGFAKQNYTMLDNLKLGYGGTKEEMERLLADAEEITGIHYDISNLNDVYSAIHVIQDELGITGTTAKEASTTISGSVNAMKASWTNLVTGVADDNADFESLVNDFVESAATVVENILPRVETTITGIGTLIENLLPVIFEEIPVLINDVLPDLIESGINMIMAFVEGISSNISLIVESALEIVTQLITSIISMLPQIIETGMQILIQLIVGIAQALPELIPQIVNVMLTIVDTLLNNIDLLLDAAFQLIIALAEGLINSLPSLIARLPEIIVKLVYTLISLAPKLGEAALKLIIALAKGLIENIPKLIESVPKLINAIVDGLKKGISKIKDIGKNLVEGLWDGIGDKVSWITDKIKGFGESVMDSIKGIFGIHSPSKEFAWIGKMCVAGFDEGIEDLDNMDSIKKNIGASLDSMKMSVNGVNDLGGNTTSYGDTNIIIQQPVKTPSETARAIRMEMQYGLAGA